MKKIVSLLLFVLVLCLCSLALADRDVEITVAGYGSISVEPDQMSVSANVSYIDPELSVAQAKVSESISGIQTALQELGIEESDIVTASYNCNTLYDYSTTPYTLTGYQTSHVLNITCHDLSLIDQVLDILVRNGMTEIYSINFDVSTRKSIYLEALALAMGSAAQKAEVLAKAAGKDKLTIKTITENVSYGYGNYIETKAAYDTDASTGIRTGDVSVDASISVVFEAE